MPSMPLMTPHSQEHPLTIIGLMSGTSLDGIDACAVKLSMPGEALDYEVVGTHSVDLPETLKQRLLALQNTEKQTSAQQTVAELSALNREIGLLLGKTAKALIDDLTTQQITVDAIASHGQTVFHQPPSSEHMDGHTLQIGEPSYIAELTSLPVIADFRPRDMAAGGQGAPLVCFADALLFWDKQKARCVQNIGGIANATVLPAMDTEAAPLAFDSGPGNMLIDLAMQRFYSQGYDKNGEMAAGGNLDTELLEKMLKHSYFELPPPKTTGREIFGEQFLDRALQDLTDIKRPQDVITTLTYFTAQTIVDGYTRFVLPTHTVDEVIIGGGGVKNKTLMRFIRELFAEACGAQSPTILTHEDKGIDSQYKEALAFAVLGWATLTGMPNNMPACTGAHQPVVMGKVIFADR